MTLTQGYPFPDDASARAAALAQRCAQATQQGDGWQACCPSHDDTTPSLSITPAGKRVLIHCHGGCTNAQIVAALGLRLSDLFVGKLSANGHRRLVKVYDYFDAAGTLVHQTVRYEPKDFRQRRPDPVNPGAYLWNLKGIEPVLYNLPAVLAAIQAGAPVHLAEGEKDAGTLKALGYVATTVPMGAKYWRESHTATLTGAQVVLWPDNDAAGQARTAKVTGHLSGKAQTLRIVTVPAPHKDVSDWVKAGGTPAEVEAAIAAATLPPAPATVRPTQEAPPQPEPALPYSDYTNALAFIRDAGQDLRYCYPWRTWLVWTKTHWQRDTSGEVMRRAKATVKKLARGLEDLEDTHKIAALMQHLKSSLSTMKLKALIENAQSEPGIAVQPAELDAHPWLLNCTNGTLDLKTGDLRAHQQRDLITRCLSVPYDPAARCPQWIAFLEHAMAGDAEMIVFLQRALGYALTGSTREQCFFLLHGPTKTGKSTWVNTVRTLLGAYARQAEASTFLHKDRTEVRNDLAMLAGARFVSAIETDQGKKLAEALVKQATGGTDAITARFLFEELFEFVPQFKVFLATNHAPKMDAQDDAIWERIHRIPFVVQIPKEERDKALDEKLHSELPGILAWAVRGCLVWQRENDLGVPQRVTDATQELRDEMDDIGTFLRECCVPGDPATHKTQAKTLLDAYHRWIGNTTLTAKALSKALTDRKYEAKRFTTGMFWLGIGLPAPEEHRKDI